MSSTDHAQPNTICDLVNPEMIHATMEHTALTQLGHKKGLQTFGKAVTLAILKELEQLHIRNVLEPIKPESLNLEEKKKPLLYLMFLKQKRHRKIKGCGYADWRRQRLDKTRDEVSSPTVSVEAVFLTSVIESTVGRDVATIDIPGAFMHVDMDETIYMRIDGPPVELLSLMDKERYGTHTRMGKTANHSYTLSPKRLSTVHFKQQ
jgi:hypothetical protein